MSPILLASEEAPNPLIPHAAELIVGAIAFLLGRAGGAGVGAVRNGARNRIVEVGPVGAERGEPSNLRAPAGRADRRGRGRG